MNGDLTRQMAVPLLDGATQFLNQHLPIMDVAQIIKNEGETGESCFSEVAARGVLEQTQDYLDRSMPAWHKKNGKKQESFLLVPASNAGKILGETIHAAFPSLHLVRVPGQSDLMFLREQGDLSSEELISLLKACRAAYENAAVAPTTSPHARYDITDWLPLEP
jgi:eukaryotic-like serine/threonine-protein kinase